MANKDIEPTSVSTKLAALIVKYRKIIIISLAVIVAVVIALLVYFGVKESSEKALAEEFYAIEKVYVQEMQKEKPDYSAVLGKLNDFIKGGKSYPEIKALYVRASVHYANKDYSKAYDDYLSVSNKVKNDNYYKSLAMFGMATSLEEQGRNKDAVSVYTEIWEKFGTESPISARALFGILRYAISVNDEALKIDMANLLNDNYAYTEYGLFAKSLLEADNKDEEK